MLKSFLRLSSLGCVVLALVALPSVSEAARSKHKTHAVAKKKTAAKASRHAAHRPRGLIVRRQAVQRAKPVQASVMPAPAPAAAVPAPAPRKPLLQRMYAAEGDLFYFNGRKYRVEGVPAPLAKQEITKQRLQQLLDSGEVSIEPRTLDDNGLTTAVIRVAGRDVAEALK